MSGLTFRWRMFLSVLAIMVLSFLLVAATVLYQQYKMAYHDAESAATRRSRTLSSIVRDSMEKGRDETVRAEIDSFGKNYPDFAFNFLNWEGNISYSTDKKSERRFPVRLTGGDILQFGREPGFEREPPLYEEPELKAMVARALKMETPAEGEGRFLKVGGKWSYVQTLTVLNDPKCYHCHGSHKQVIGASLLIMDCADSIRSFAKNAAVMGGISFAALAVAGLLLYFLTRRLFGIIGTVVEECGALTEACTAGRLSLRGDSEKIEPEFRPIVDGINRMLDAVITPLNLAADYVDRIGRGDIPPPITGTYLGDFNSIKENLNACCAGISELISETNGLIQSAITGKLSARADASGHRGDYRKIAEGLNSMIDALVGHIDNVPVPVILMDKEFNIQFINRRGATLLGIPRRQILNTKCYEHFKTPDCRTENCACAAALKEGREVSRETDVRVAGTDLRIQYTGNPIKDENGAVIGVMEVAMDITAIRNAQRVAAKQAEYQAGEVEKLVVNLKKLGEGDTNIETVVAPPDEDTAAVHQTFTVVGTSLNQCAGAIMLLISDMNSLAQAAVEGRLSVRADASAHGGDYREIVEGVNRTLDAVIGPINEATICLKAMAERDMGVVMSGSYQGDHTIIKDALNRTLDSVNGMLQEIREATSQIYAGATQVSDSSNSLSQGATEQAASIEEITSSITELASQTKANAEHAAQANRLAVDTRESAEKGSRQMSEMVLAMKGINDASQNIAKIIKVIDDIAFQTNLLALNAAVEAARAGRHGKGFAVVAEEVRNLASRSAKAAKETTELIEGSVKRVAHGSDIAGKSAQALDEIVRAATKTTDLVGEIAAASNEQAQGIAQINLGLNQIDSVTQQNTANAEETAAASQELTSQAGKLNQILSYFKLKERKPGDGMVSLGEPRYPTSARAGRRALSAPRRQTLEWKPVCDEPNEEWDHTAPEDIINLDDSEFGKY